MERKDAIVFGGMIRFLVGLRQKHCRRHRIADGRRTEPVARGRAEVASLLKRLKRPSRHDQGARDEVVRRCAPWGR